MKKLAFSLIFLLFAKSIWAFTLNLKYSLAHGELKQTSQIAICLDTKTSVSSFSKYAGFDFLFKD
jgi:hypothetical protein